MTNRGLFVSVSAIALCISIIITGIADASVVFSDDFETHSPGALGMSSPIGTGWNPSNSIAVVSSPVLAGSRSLQLTRDYNGASKMQFPALYGIATAGSLVAGYDLTYTFNAYRSQTYCAPEVYFYAGEAHHIYLGGFYVANEASGNYYVFNAGLAVDTGYKSQVQKWEKIECVLHLVDVGAGKIGGTYDVFITPDGGTRTKIASNCVLVASKSPDGLARLLIYNHPQIDDNPNITYWDNLMIEMSPTIEADTSQTVQVSDLPSVKAIGPAALMVSCGDVLIRIDGPMKWTINRVEYKGTPLWIENSSCGTVFGFPGIGWIGTGHLADCKDGSEDVLKLQLWLDGKEMSWLADKSFSSKELQLYLVEPNMPLPWPVETVKGKEFKQHKISRILDFDLDCIIELRDNRLYEQTTISTKKQIPVTQNYNFTHAWTHTFTAFLAHAEDGKELQDTFGNDKRKEYSLERIVWTAQYDANSGKGVISYLLEKPAEGGADLLIVNAPGVYRKFALMCFTNKTVPADFNGKYRMVTVFFEAPADKWQDVARKLANNLNVYNIDDSVISLGE
jgi:hypothetical protein